MEHRERGIREVDGVAVLARHRATCHCGEVELALDLPDGIVDPRRCDCSICRRKGAVVASVPLAGLHVVRGADRLRLYQFNTHTAGHAASTPTTSAAPTRSSTATTSAAWMGSIR